MIFQLIDMIKSVNQCQPVGMYVEGWEGGVWRGYSILLRIGHEYTLDKTVFWKWKKGRQNIKLNKFCMDLKNSFLIVLENLIIFIIKPVFTVFKWNIIFISTTLLA